MKTACIKDEIVTRMNEMIAEADRIRAKEKLETRVENDWIYDRPAATTFRSYPEDPARIWQHNFGSVIVQVVDTASVHWDAAKSVIDAGNLEYAIDEGRLLLLALVDDLKRGLLDKLILRVQADITADYLGMAEGLLREGVPGQHEHVPAAVLAGAVLERGLRDLCGRQTPPIETSKPNGEPKTMNPLIDDLKKAGAFNELRAKQIRAWADIRNAAAHGEFEKFNRSQVESMVPGVTAFLADVL